MVGENGEALNNPKEFLPVSTLQGSNDDSWLLATSPYSLSFLDCWRVSCLWGRKSAPLGEHIRILGHGFYLLVIMNGLM